MMHGISLSSGPVRGRVVKSCNDDPTYEMKFIQMSQTSFFRRASFVYQGPFSSRRKLCMRGDFPSRAI